MLAWILKTSAVSFVLGSRVHGAGVGGLIARRRPEGDQAVEQVGDADLLDRTSRRTLA